MLIKTFIFLAAAGTGIDPEEDSRLEALRKGSGFGGADTTLVLGAIMLLAAAVFFWAFFIRKRPKTARGSLVIEKIKKGELDKDSERFGSSGRRRRRKRRPDHPDNLPRNPTLMETGGLPPLRPDEPEPPSSPGAPQAQ